MCGVLSCSCSPLVGLFEGFVDISNPLSFDIMLVEMSLEGAVEDSSFGFLIVSVLTLSIGNELGVIADVESNSANTKVVATSPGMSAPVDWATARSTNEAAK